MLVLHYFMQLDSLVATVAQANEIREAVQAAVVDLHKAVMYGPSYPRDAQPHV